MIMLIDGYNLIFSGFASPDNTHSDYLERLRDNLVSQLKSYNTGKKHRITVVFDGDKTNSYYPQEKESSGIRIAFSQGKATADDLIIEMALSHVQNKPHHHGLCVVTSDSPLTETLVNHKVKVISSQEFAVELAFRNKDISKGLKGEPIEKFIGLKPSDVPKWLKVFSKEEHE